MSAMLAYADTDDAYAVSTAGEHSFATGVPGQRVLVSLPLTGAQVSFLSRNPAAVRCLATQGLFDGAWLDRLIASVSAIGAGVETAGGIH